EAGARWNSRGAWGEREQANRQRQGGGDSGSNVTFRTAQSRVVSSKALSAGRRKFNRGGQAAPSSETDVRPKKSLPNGRGSDWRSRTSIGAATVRERSSR